MNEEILKHYKLIYKVLSDMGIQNQKRQEEYFFDGLMGLYNGIRTYDKQKTKESTYYYTCIKNEIIKRFLYEKRKKYNYKKYDISINTPISESHTIEDTLICDVDIEQEIINKELYEIVVNELRKLKNTKWKQYMFELYGIDGTPQLTLTELSKKYGVRPHAIQSGIMQGIKRIRNELKEKL